MTVLPGGLITAYRNGAQTYSKTVRGMTMKTTTTAIAGLLGAALILPSAAQANRGYKPANCAIYAELAADTIKADSRVTGTAESEAVDSLGKYAAHLSGIVEAGMADTYAQSAAFGYDKAKVDQMIAEGEAALRAGFHTSTMDGDKVYTDHLLALNSCAEGSQRAGHLGAADVQKLGARLNAVYMAIR